MTHDTDLAKNLTEAGHPDLAEQLQRKQLAGESREQGRDDLADALERKSPAKQPTPAEARQQADEEFLKEIKAKASDGWTSTPGLLDR